jgi:hypothetical protein
MKILSHIIALLLVSANSLQIIVIIGMSIIMLKLSLDKLKAARHNWINRKRKRLLESDMWAIE